MKLLRKLPPAVGEHRVALGGDWDLSRDFAVRGAGFPVSGLETFGGEDESAALRRVASDSRFQEAVTWQNPSALRNQILKAAAGPASKPSRQRQREELVASYWQRYTAKNDTIGFFGPLGWGRVRDDGPALSVNEGPLVGERVVHFEHWGIQALADVVDSSLRVPLTVHPDRDLRAMLDGHPDGEVRARGLAMLDRFVAARDRVANADPAELLSELDSLNAVFSEITGAEGDRRPGESYAGRTLVYLDCLRGTSVEIGPGILDELRSSLPIIFAAGRWYCERAHAVGQEIVAEAIRRNPTARVPELIPEIMPRLLVGPPEYTEILREVHHRLLRLAAAPPAERVGLAEELFGERGELWPIGVYSSTDIQIAAASTEAADRGEFLCVAADVHPGTNPLAQSVFAMRHPDRERFLREWGDDVGRPQLLMPPVRPQGVSPRVMFGVTEPDDIHVIAGPIRPPLGYRSIPVEELRIDGGDVVSDDGSLRIPVPKFFAIPIQISAVRLFRLTPVDEHAERLTLGRTVVRRETWNPDPRSVPADADAFVRWARAAGMPRRLFLMASEEPKPFYVDLESPTLRRIACRAIRRTADAEGGSLEISEMLPAPEDCWLRDADGGPFTSELRIVAVDRTRIAGG
jgi:hypothetical protein